MLAEQNSLTTTGSIEVICGSMFSGKTEELIRRLKRAQIANKKVEIFKPHIDTRYHPNKVVSHDSNSIHCTPVTLAENILLMAEGMDVIGIDEAQFMDEELPSVCEKLVRQGVRIVIAGLDMDSNGQPFGPMPALLAIADFITKVQAICVKCGQTAHFTYRTSTDQSKILLGEKGHYEPRCRICYHKGILI